MPTSASISDQLAAWNPAANGSALRALIPSPKVNRHSDEDEDQPIYNPFKLFGMVDGMGWLMFFSGWLAWTTDGYDYFSVSLTAKLLGEQFKRGTKDITTAITLTLLFRSLGAIMFGVAADRYGRKWTLVINLLLIAVFELGSGFCQTYGQFLVVRAFFGVAMGGIWGQAASTALENVPVQARGLCSGILQQGYAVGYLIAAVVNLGIVSKSPYTWRSIYFFGAGLSTLAAIVRACLPESRQFIDARRAAKESGISSGDQTKAFGRELKNMLKSNWIRCIWGICFMTGFNFFSHGSQDLYPTYLQVTKGLSSALASKATIIANCGAIAGGTIAGYISQFLGRRVTIIVFVLFTGAFIPLWILPSGFGLLSLGAFFVQFGVQGAWGTIPVYLSEIAPPAFRASFAGVAYQLGNMASSAAAQIEATAGEHLKLADGKTPDYATIQGILIGVVAAWIIIFTILGPEAHGAHFEHAHVAYQEGAGAAAATDLVRRPIRGDEESAMAAKRQHGSQQLDKPVDEKIERV